MRTGEVILCPPPFEMEQELWRVLGRRPTAAVQSRTTLSQGQVHAFNKGRIESPAQPQPAAGGSQFLRCPTAHPLGYAHQWAPPIDRLDLTIAQPCCHLPVGCPSSLSLHPFPKMGCACIEGEIQSIVGEHREAGGDELLAQRVEKGMSSVLGPGSELQHRDDLAAGVDRQPQPEDMRPAAQAGAQFVQLDMREGKVLQGAVMPAPALLKSACQPGGESDRLIPKHASSRFHIQAFAQRGEHFPNTGGWSFEAVERGIAPGAEGRAAGLTAKDLNAFACAV